MDFAGWHGSFLFRALEAGLRPGERIDDWP